MTDGVSVYNKPVMDQMYQELKQYHGLLGQAGRDDFQTASEKLKAAWTDPTDNTINQAYTGGYEIVKNKFDGEFTDTLTVLENIATALENALANAGYTDAKIADGFGA
ncbi:hypothetical protein [Nocardia sp. NPDC050406]|uniref:hypothetical protein n=1 Tax=Nocardia sp. NPDC050406 TaxID=3364318 RepID=UPI0037A28AD8